ncbi:bifunctional 4-hydroxy-2-oxoglutarate aldolase/2-dehydro-3-deoxy-phosphogluconate aldolase [Pseudoalteromonas piscicida]
MDYLKDKVVAVLVINTLDGLSERLNKLLQEGYDVFEVTLRTDCALDSIKYIKENFPETKIGAGTILSKEQLQASVECGADFAVSPGLDEGIVSYAKSIGFDYVPGVSTPTEIQAALNCGVRLVKLFPVGVMGGVAYVKALSGPFRDIQFMPTGGISSTDAEQYLSLQSVLCVGGSWMFKD